MIKAIETEYNGLKFRSRIEARWAYVFDLLGVKYEYEKETYELPAGAYLPDFWLPQMERWVEIKGVAPNEREDKLAYQLASKSEHPVIIFWGEIPWTDVDSDSGYIYYPEQGWDCLYCLCECPNCGMVGIQFTGRSDRLPCKTMNCPTYSVNGDKGYTGDGQRIQTAYRLARQARFEWGETPRPHRLQFYPYPPDQTTDDYAFARQALDEARLSITRDKDLPF